MSDINTPLLSVNDLRITLPDGAERPHAIENVSFHLNAGEVLCIVGESGSGKSMIANALLGLLPKPHVMVDKGTVVFQEQSLLELDEPDLQRVRGKEISMIFQEPMTALNPVMRIDLQIEEVFMAHGIGSKAKRKQAVLKLLREVNLPDPEAIGKSFPFKLSGGQRQRVMIAMALALEPKILIADEPTTALDVTTQAQILTLISDLQKKRGMGVIFITHDLGVVAEIADRIMVLRKGKVVEDGSANEILRNPQHPYTQELIASVPRLVANNRSDKDNKPIVLKVDGLNKEFRDSGGLFRKGRVTHAVDDVSFVLRQGETLGVVGESGSGKSTLSRCMTKLLVPNSGGIQFHGEDLLQLNGVELRQHRKRVQMIFQDPYASLNPRRTIGQTIADGPIAYGSSKAEAMEKTLELLEITGLDKGAADRFPHEFSGGQRQRVGLARALALEPEVLIADEPVSALDVSVQAKVLDLLENLMEKLEFAMIFVTHDLRVAARICDRIAVMQRGKVIEIGRTEQVLFTPEHEYTQRLLAAVPGRNWRAQ